MTKTSQSLLSDARQRKIFAIIASFIVILALFAFLFFETTKATIALEINGDEQTVKTNADTVGELLAQQNIKVQGVDSVYPATDAKIRDQMSIVFQAAEEVTLTLNGEANQVWTTATTVGEFLKQQGLSLKEADQVSPGVEEPITSDLQVELEEAFRVNIVDGTKKKTAWTTSTTVADFLKQQGIILNDSDRIAPKLDAKLTEKKNEVNVVRVEKVTDVVEEETNFKTVTRNDSSLTSGQEKVVQEGKRGKRSKKYEVVLENGKEVSRTLLAEEVLSESQDKIVAVGTRRIVAQVSRSNTTAPASGKTIKVSSTAYTANCAGCSGITATGINLKANPNQKVIAVDPSLIPLGTKVYVEGYGYAVAADTGSSINGNKIDVFFASKEQAYRWGSRTVTIRILD